MLTNIATLTRILIPSLVCAGSACITSIAWDGSGSKLAIGDEMGNIWIKRMVGMNLADWMDVYTTTLASEIIIKTEFVSSSRIIK